MLKYELDGTAPFVIYLFNTNICVIYLINIPKNKLFPSAVYYKCVL